LKPSSLAPTRPAACSLRRRSCSSLLSASPPASPPSRGIGRVVPGWGDPPARGPGPAAPGLRGLGLTRRGCGIPWVTDVGGSGRMCRTHGAPVAPALQAVGTGGVVLEHVGPVDETQGLPVLGLAHLPGNPQYGRPAIGSLAARCHCGYLLCPQTREGRPRSPPEGASGVGLLQPGVSPLLSPGATGPGNCIRLFDRT
jgi:hypothetical protein